jgi:hypothetical protein
LLCETEPFALLTYRIRKQAMTTTAARRPYPRILAATAIAAAASAALNSGLRYSAVAAFDIPQPQFKPFYLPAVLTLSVVAAAAGGAFFALLTRLTHRPMRIFLPVATTVLALSMIPPVGVSLSDPSRLPGASAAAGLSLALMHLLVAVVLLTALRWADHHSTNQATR